jgi:hypothetical protein
LRSAATRTRRESSTEIRMNYSRETAFAFRERRKRGVRKWVRSFPFWGDGTGLRDSVFEPHEIKAMSTALDEVCEALKLHNDISAKQVMAARIIDLVRCGERSTKRLRERVLYEAGLAEKGQGRNREALFPEGTSRHT